MRQTLFNNVEELFFAAREIESQEARSAFLNQACADTEVRRRVEQLLALDPEAHEFLADPASMPTLDFSCDSRPGVEEPGTVIGPYKLMEQIGEGGMGVVYVAEQHEPVRRRVALKVVKPGMDSKQVIARFEAERQALALMDHPNIAKVHDAGTTESGRPYFVMELVKGIPITEYCERERLSIPERLELFILVCRAVQHAHLKGIIHRDLKPSNMLVTVIDGVAVPKVIDFGVAKATGQSLTERTVYTSFQQLVGTPLYMSPEQAALSGVDVDTRSDVYSLGVLLYELLTGTTPFDREQFHAAAFDEMRRIIREEDPPTPSSRVRTTLPDSSTDAQGHPAPDVRRLSRQLHRELDWIVMRSLEKDRDRRYETAGAFATDLRRFLDDETVEAHPPSVGYRLRKTARRNKGLLTTAALVGLTLIVGTAVSTWQAFRAWDAEEEARSEQAIAEAVTNFLQNDVLGQANPKNNRDGDITVREALARASERIDEQFLEYPRVEAAIRKTIAGALQSLGDFEEAERHFRRVLEINRRILGPDNRQTLVAQFFVAIQCSNQGRHSEAIALLGEVVETNRRVRGPEEGFTLNAMVHLATAYTRAGNRTEAERLYRQAIEINPKNKDVILFGKGNLGAICLSERRYAEAETLLQEVVEWCRNNLDKDHPFGFGHKENLGFLYYRQGRLTEAEPLICETLKARRRVLGPEHTDTLRLIRLHDEWINALVREFSTNRRWNEAETWSNGYLERDPEDSLVWAVRGFALAELEKSEEAEQAFARAQELVNDPPVSWNRFCWNAVRFGASPRIAAACVRLMQSAVESHPTKDSHWGTLGVARYRAGDWAGAIDTLEHAIEVGEGRAFAFSGFFIAMAHVRLGNEGLAREWFYRSVTWMEQADPRFGELRRFRKETAELLEIAARPMPNGLQAFVME